MYSMLHKEKQTSSGNSDDIYSFIFLIFVLPPCNVLTCLGSFLTLDINICMQELEQDAAYSTSQSDVN